MAIYHCSVKIIGRSSGRSSVAASAYRAGQKITDERTGTTHDYTRKTGVAHSEIILPSHAPNEYNDRATLWNAVEKKECRNDSQTAREIEFALPLEFTLEENIQTVRNYINENFIDKGMCADFSIHENPNNPHAHILLTTREISLDGFGKKNRDWNNIKLLEQWRENWAKECNLVLAEKGIQKIDHRSLEAQGLERTPTIHVGISKVRKARNKKIIKSNEKYEPLAIAEYMNELNEGYNISKNYVNELNQNERESSRAKDKIKAISRRSNDLRIQYRELEQAKTERDRMGIFKNKKEINTKVENMERAYKHSHDYFERTYKISPNEVDSEIRRMKDTIKNTKNADKDFYIEKMNMFEKEYKRQRLLAEIRQDGKEIFADLDRADVKLNKITNDDYREITQDLRPSQIALLENERYNHTQIKAKGFYDLER